jgi:NAD(P)-dependent dehydrogenase (short-subunit alcohol dehydrogenase family)
VLGGWVYPLFTVVLCELWFRFTHRAQLGAPVNAHYGTLQRREVFLKTVITKWFAKSEEVAKTIVWLATESPEYINGTCIDKNNG